MGFSFERYVEDLNRIVEDVIRRGGDVEMRQKGSQHVLLRGFEESLDKAQLQLMASPCIAPAGHLTNLFSLWNSQFCAAIYIKGQAVTVARLLRNR